jgi:hypothetical protein
VTTLSGEWPARGQFFGGRATIPTKETDPESVCDESFRESGYSFPLTSACFHPSVAPDEEEGPVKLPTTFASLLQ